MPITPGDKSDNSNHPTPAKGSPSFSNALIAAGVSGFVGANTSFIFESIKKRLQTGQPLPSPKMGAVPFVRESFRGLSGFIASLVPTSMVQQSFDYYLSDPNSNASAMFSGAMGGIASTMVENTILAQQKNKCGPLQAIGILNSQGPTRIFRGFQLIWLREAGFGYMYLKGAEQAGQYANKNWGANYILPAQLCAGVVGSLVTHPLDTTASTMQNMGFKKIIPTVKYLFNENGVRAFYKGGLARCALFTTAMLSIKESKKRTLEALEGNNTAAPPKPR